MALKLSKTYYWWVVAALIIGATALIATALTASASGPIQPEASPPPTHTAPTPKAETPVVTPEAAPEEPEPLTIPESAILQIQIPALSLTIPVSGETYPRETVNCQGGTVLCIDPPTVDQAAWYGATPATPSAGTVRLFGHTSYIESLAAAFDAIPAVKDGDEIVVTTEAGIFTYRAGTPQLVPYAEVPQSQLIWADTADRLILVTCNNPAGAGTVIEAWLTKAVER